MEQEKIKWYQSKIVRTAGALFAGSIGYIGVSIGYFNAEDLSRAQTVYPEVQTGIELIKAGQVLAGITAVLSPLVVYFRIFKNSRLIV